MIRFQHIEYLWILLALPLLILLYIGYLRWRKKALQKIGDTNLVKKLIWGHIAGRSTTHFVLLLLAILFGTIGLANLQKGAQTEKAERKGIDVIYALDVSKSMLAKDIQPDRLSRAKQMINRMMEKMANDRVGLVVFAGKAYLQVPLTIDYSATKMLLESVKPQMIPTQGTVLGEAIKLANESFSIKDKKHKAIVLISDGEDHDESALSEVKKAVDNGVVIYTIGVGSSEGGTIIDPETGVQKLDENGNPVITKLNQDELKSIASEGNGAYWYLNNANTVADDLISNIEKIESKSYGTVQFTDYNSYYQYFIAVALLLIVASWLLPNANSIKNTTTSKLKT